MSQDPNKIGNSRAINEGQDPRQTIKQTNFTKNLLSSGERKYSVSSDQTLKNTIDAMNLLKRQ